MDDAASAPGLTPREVPVRVLPVPRTVSPQLQKSIANAALAPRLAPEDAPKTADDWRRHAAANNAQTLKMTPMLQARFPFEVELKTIAGVTVREITPASLDPAKAGRVLIHLHGGGYVMNGGEASISEGVLAAHRARTRVLSVDYRMPPDHPFPAAIEDAVAVWTAVIQDHAPASVGVFGASAGGGLTLALCLKLKALGLALPGAIAPSTPWTDLAGESDSYATNAHVDGIFSDYAGAPAGMARLYANGASLRDPLISPVHGDFTGFPPAILTTGTRDILLSDTVRVYRAMRAAGVEARLEVHEAMSHAEYAFAATSPESAVVYQDIAAFFERWLQA